MASVSIVKIREAKDFPDCPRGLALLNEEIDDSFLPLLSRMVWKLLICESKVCLKIVFLDVQIYKNYIISSIK